ncbi:hypothetical protein LY76DRAFT_688622 [Colletotrichum caudatum]|nr:hypothetical protein LY76DRAFT_688622 [Colletotrichum caudatum]
MDALIHRLSAVDRQLQELKRCQSERIRRQHKQIGRITADLRGTERVMNELPYSFSSGGSSVGDGDR